MRRADIVSGLVLTLFGIVSLFAIIPAQVGSDAGDSSVAPDLFPLTLMWLLTGLAVLLWVSRLAQSGKMQEEEPAPLEPNNFFFIVAASIGLLGSYLAITYLGFIVGSVLTVALWMLAMGGRRHPIRLVVASLVAPALIYVFFRHLFTVLLP
jgi:hypothetical protein